MFARIALCFHNGTDFLACISRIEVVEQIAERGKIVVALVAVYSVVDGDIAYVALGKEALGVVAHFQIVATYTGHILDDNCLDLSYLRKAYHFIPAGSIKRNTRYAVINEKCRI